MLIGLEWIFFPGRTMQSNGVWQNIHLYITSKRLKSGKILEIRNTRIFVRDQYDKFLSIVTLFHFKKHLNINSLIANKVKTVMRFSFN